MICLGDSDDENASGILKLLEVLLSSDREVKEKKEILQNDFSIEMTKTLEREVSTMCNLSKGVEEQGIQKGIEPVSYTHLDVYKRQTKNSYV